MHRLTRPALAAALAVLLTGCTGAHAGAPDWRPQPSFQGEGDAPSIIPVQPPRPSPSAPAPSRSRSGPGPSGSPSQTSTEDPAVVAKHLSAPTGLALLPDGTALVGERTTGRILQVQPMPDRPVREVRRLTGLSTAGDGGLLDLALSPHYVQDALIFAYVTTATDNRVVAFTMTGPVTPVVTGIPKGATGNAGRITFGPDGSLYVGTGDAGRPALAADPRSLAGKVLRVSDIGRPADGNPTPGSPVFTSGHRAVAGLCAEPRTGTMLEIDTGTTGAVVNVLAPGASYGWPSADPGDHPALAQLPNGDSTPGGCAVLNNVLYVSSLDGRVLLGATVQVRGNALALGAFNPTLKNKYGRLRTVVAAPDGALWLTTSNRDGHGRPVPDDERVLRIVPSGGAAAQPV